MALPYGYIMERIHIPYNLVGLVVGLKGANIKRIQKDAQAFIVTPSKDREPIFVLIGQPVNVKKARRMIELHIERRTHNKACVITLPPLTTVSDKEATEALLSSHCHDAQQWSVLVQDQHLTFQTKRCTGNDTGSNVNFHCANNIPKACINPWTKGLHSVKVPYFVLQRNRRISTEGEKFPTNATTAREDNNGLGFDVVAWITSALLNSEGEPSNPCSNPDDFDTKKPSETSVKRSWSATECDQPVWSSAEAAAHWATFKFTEGIMASERTSLN
ncbi:RNA binding protein MEX3B [Trichuris trichiura]|uniref:RNA binding protein MEX3B n=1 Tax=Trichuris trichiura TaxID=36087 RepID=A0A077Z797_TRITR|nr:RNA binding protein MEX3B [Trichuris trichiura]